MPNKIVWNLKDLDADFFWCYGLAGDDLIKDRPYSRLYIATLQIKRYNTELQKKYKPKDLTKSSSKQK